MGKNRLSNSAANKFMSCAEEYNLHYNKRLRGKYQSAALFFGSAVDSGMNSLLKNDGKDPFDVFDYSWRFARLDGQEDREYLTDSNKIVYSDKDFDKDLLGDDDINLLKEKTSLITKDEVLEYYKVLSEKKKQYSWNKLSLSDQKMFNLYNWLSLRKKGHLMIETFKQKIAPNIIKVLDVQRYIKLENEKGDSIIGYVDLICEWKNEGVVIFDLKTSSIRYEDESVLTSPQLTLYKAALYDTYKTDKCGYLVLSKTVNKNRVKICSVCKYDGSGARHKTCSNEYTGSRCGGEWIETVNPSIDVQVIIDSIPKRTEEIVMQNYEQINKSIKDGNFSRNLNNCVRPWGKCVYFDYCYKDDKSDLIQLESSKK